jgi:hypothetical protein
MARVYERGGRWYYEFRFNGRQIRKSARTAATKNDAFKLMARPWRG